MKPLIRSTLGSVAFAFAFAAFAGPAHGAITVGNVIPGATSCSGAQEDIVQTASTTGTPYVVPTDGTITGWSTAQGASDPGMNWKLKIYRRTALVNVFQVIGVDGPRTLTANTLNTFSAGVNIPVKSGDVLGINRAVGSSSCSLAGGGTTLSLFPSDLAQGSSGAFTSTSNRRINVSANLEPLNTFTFGAVTRNKKKGTAQLTVAVPSSGSIAVGGAGVKAATAAVAAKGDVTLPVRAAGKKKKKLRSKGKVNVAPQVTFTPTQGSPGVQSTKLKLKRK